MHKKGYDTIIFDLDGTLLDTSEGIFGSVRYAEEKMHLKSIDDKMLASFLGPPPKEMYKTIYGLSEIEASAAAKAHREYSAKRGMYEAKVYFGMEESLKTLQNRGYRMAVATLKNQTIAEAILEYFGIRGFFETIVGMDEAESLSKKETISIAAERTGASFPIMVGDSKYDYYGATEANVDFLGVLYGFGFKNNEEFLFKTIKTPKELVSVFE